MIYNQIVTWTAFAILAMFLDENVGFCKAGKSSQSMSLLIHEARRKSARIKTLCDKRFPNKISFKKCVLKLAKNVFSDLQKTNYEVNPIPDEAAREARKLPCVVCRL